MACEPQGPEAIRNASARPSDLTAHLLEQHAAQGPLCRPIATKPLLGGHHRRSSSLSSAESARIPAISQRQLQAAQDDLAAVTGLLDLKWGRSARSPSPKRPKKRQAAGRAPLARSSSQPVPSSAFPGAGQAQGAPCWQRLAGRCRSAS